MFRKQNIPVGCKEASIFTDFPTGSGSQPCTFGNRPFDYRLCFNSHQMSVGAGPVQTGWRGQGPVQRCGPGPCTEGVGPKQGAVGSFTKEDPCVVRSMHHG